MKNAKQCFRQGQVQPMATSMLFGGYEPVSCVLQLSVEANSVDQARTRMASVASLVAIEGVEELEVLQMLLPSRLVPFFMEGYFEAIQREAAKLNLK